MAYSYYKFRIYPNKEQEVVLNKTIGCCRYIYNWGLNLVSEAYKKDKTNIGYSKTSAMMTLLKKEPELIWLNDVSSVALQQSLRNLERARSRFFKKIAKYPKFKSKRNDRSFRLVGEGFRIKRGLFYINKIESPIKVAWSREFPSKPSSCSILKTPSGQWFVNFICKIDSLPLPKASNRIGIDLGIETFATLSDGTKIKQPKSIKGSREKLARAQRNQDRKKLGSNNYNKARLKVASIHQKIVNIRTNFLQKLSTQLIRENQTIAIEDLGVSNMIRNRKLSRCISEQGWRDFRGMLEYKANWYGRELVVVDRFFPSSKTCSCCGKRTELTLKDRVWSCICGATHDRDVNAAQNILAAGMAVSACGVDVRPVLNGRLTAKQEVSLEMAG